MGPLGQKVCVTLKLRSRKGRSGISNEALRQALWGGPSHEA